MPESKRDFVERQRSKMREERQSFIPHWQDLAKFVKPRKGRWLISDVNKGDRRNQHIMNSTATTAHRRCRSGVMSGLMSPSRPWFIYETADDPGLMEYGPVQQWLYYVQMQANRIFRQSNLYSMTPEMIGEMILFGTGCMSHVDDFKDVARFYTRTAGSYMIDLDNRMKVNTLCLEFQWTVGQIVAEYGLANCSDAVRNAYSQGNYGSRFEVVQYVGPNPEYDATSPYARHMPFTSCHYEPAGDKGKWLRESGFNEFPAFCPRWDVTGEDVYATDCPAMTALGDTKGIQHKEKRKAQGLDKIVTPPLKGPASLQRIAVSSLPGALTAYDGDSSREGLSPIYQVTGLNLQEVRIDIEADAQRIKEAFYNDLFRAISDLEGVQPQNEMFLTQVNQERLLELGPMIERFQGEFQDPLHDRTFAQMARAGILPPPPKELQGRPLRADYVGPMAMAAKAVATNNIDRVAAFAGGLMKAGFTDAGYKFNAPQAIDEYAKALGTPPGIIVPDEEMMQRMEEDRKKQEAMMMAEGANQGAQALKGVADAAAAGQK